MLIKKLKKERQEVKINRFANKTTAANLILHFFILLFPFSLFPFAVSAQRIAVLTPDKNGQSENFAKKLETSLSGKFKILDKSLTETAFNSSIYEQPFNLSLEDAKNIGAAIGCDYFLLIQSRNLRRFSLDIKEFYESFAAVYIVSSRSGRLVFWKLVKGKAKTANEADGLLFSGAENLAAEIAGEIKKAERAEIGEVNAPGFEEPPEENSPDAENFQPPLPFKRIRPQYTETANLYSVEATVDILLDVDENGKIRRTQISRWAGFGLDEAVIKTVLEMNWRPASRNGKTLPVRILLRYNFKKLDKD